MATGRKTVVVGQVIDPNTWGNLVWDQSVQTFASAADRTAQFPAPKAGAVTFLEDVKQWQGYDGAAWRELDPAPAYIAPTYNAAYGPIFPQGLVIMRKGQTIVIGGGITNLTPTTWAATQKLSVATVPAGWRPASGEWIAPGLAAAAGGGVSSFLAPLSIDAAGLVTWQPTVGQATSLAAGGLRAIFSVTIPQAVP